VPRYFPSVDSAKETILADNLRNTRAVIDQYRSDTGRYPDSLEQLVEKKYLRELPLDPIAESREAWVVVPPEEGEQGGVYNLHSGAPGNGRDGRPYAEW
jgi:general secretion pathway protein G